MDETYSTQRRIAKHRKAGQHPRFDGPVTAVVLVGRADVRTEHDIRREAHAFGVRQHLEIYKNLEIDEVAALLDEAVAEVVQHQRLVGLKLERLAEVGNHLRDRNLFVVARHQHRNSLARLLSFRALRRKPGVGH
jgi:hypothetical protein